MRAGRNESQRRLSSAVSPVYSTRTNMHFDTTRSIQRSFVHSTTMSPLYRVPAVFAPRDSEPARRGDRLLSHVEMSGHETQLERRIRTRMPHSTYTGLYTIAPVDSILISSSPSAQRMFPRPNAQTYLLNRQWISILPGTSCPSVETNRADEASRIPILS